ncbi:hypothetical protein D9M71_803420 [compost metagenome]
METSTSWVYSALLESCACGSAVTMSTMVASSSWVVKKCSCLPSVEVRNHFTSTLGSISPEARAWYISGVALFSALVKTNGLCTRWPDGWPLCGSVGVAMRCLISWTRISSS